MSKCVITLEDIDEENFRGSVEYEDGYNVNSKAQISGYLLMQHLNELAQNKGDEVRYGNAPSVQDSESQVAANDEVKAEPSLLILPAAI